MKSTYAKLEIMFCLCQKVFSSYFQSFFRSLMNKFSDSELHTGTNFKPTMVLGEKLEIFTPSRFGEIAKTTCRRNTEKLCKSHLFKPLLHRKIIHFKINKHSLIRKYHPKTSRCGLFICTDKPFLIATQIPLVILTILFKCPYNGRHTNKRPGPNFK